MGLTWGLLHVPITWKEAFFWLIAVTHLWRNPQRKFRLNGGGGEGGSTTEYIFYCKRAILFLSSSKILTPHPPLRPAIVYPRLCCGRRTDSPGGEGGGGSIFWKTREIGLPSYSKKCTLWGRPKGRLRASLRLIALPFPALFVYFSNFCLQYLTIFIFSDRLPRLLLCWYLLLLRWEKCLITFLLLDFPGLKQREGCRAGFNPRTDHIVTPHPT